MNQSRSSLITSFFKSPPASETINGAPSLEGISCDDEDSRSSVGGGEGGVRFAVNLNGHSSQQAPHTCPVVTTTSSSLENGALSLSTVSSGMRQGTLTWSSASGTLSLKPSVAEAKQSSPPPTLVQSVHHTSPLPSSREECSGGGVREVAVNVADEVGVAPDREAGRRSRRSRCQEVDYCEILKDDSFVKRKRRKRWGTVVSRQDKTELVVTVERSLLRRVPGEEPCLCSEPGSGDEVEVTLSVEGELDESVVILSPPRPPSSATLSGPWARIFSRPVKQDSSFSSARQTAVRTGTDPGSPVRSPRKRGQRSASCSPRRLARSPRAPRHCSPLRSPRKGTNSTTAASPLKNSLQPRVLILPSAKKPRLLEFDHAPFLGLVHVRQESVSEPFWTLTSAGTGLRPVTPPTDRDLSLQPSLGSCLSLHDVVREDHTSLLTPVTSAEQRASILETLSNEHPQERVRHLIQRYRNIREGGADHTHSETPPTSHAEQGKRTRQPLVCKIHILNGRRERVKVDEEVYRGKSNGKRSLRLSKKRSISLTENSVREGLTEGGVERRGCEVGRGEGEKREGVRQSSCDMWTELYRPQSSSEVIGNKVKVQQLYSWLRNWTNKSVGQSDKPLAGGGGGRAPPRNASRELKRSGCKRSREGSPTPEWTRGSQDFLSLSHLRRKMRRKRVEGSSDSETEGEESGEEGEGVSLVLLLCGGVGSGKTAAVHACAAELGCKVFEVNAGSVRSRGHLLGTLKEATLSHHVSLQPLVGVVNQTASERGVKLSTNPKKKKKKKEKKKGSSGILTFFKRADQRESDKERGEGRSGRPVSLESSTVILLEEVDVLFDSDRGFWSGVYDLIATTRRPIILTSNDSRFELDCHHIKIVFGPPPLEELGMHIQLLCLSCDYHMTSDAAVQLADSLHVDIRRLFLCLQFWTSQCREDTSSHLSLHTLSGLTRHDDGSESSSLLPPHLSLPWRSSKPHPLTSDLYRDIDMASHHAEQDSYLDVISMETASDDCHMGRDDIISRAWWRTSEGERAGLLDELPERVCRWREEEVGRGVCEEVERRRGRTRLQHDPIPHSQFTRRVQSVRQCLEKCSKVFALTSTLVGVVSDSLPLLRTICSSETTRKLSHTKRRFRHYLQQNASVDQTDLDTLPLATRFPSTHN